MSRSRIRRRIPVPARIVVLVSLMMLLAACSVAGAQSKPTWVPAVTPSSVPLPTQVPDNGSGGSSGGSSGSSGGSSGPSSGPTGGSSSSTPVIDPYVVATKLTTPGGIAVLPDGTALVAERTTGKLVIVQPGAGHPVMPAKTLTGFSTSGGGGVLAIALSATYDEDKLIFALITTDTDTRLVHFTLTGPVTPVLVGIPRGSSDNTGTLLVLGNGEVLIGTGDAGQPALAVNPASLAGKVLRVNDLGAAAPGNPTAGSRVFASGLRTVNGLCVDATTSAIFATEAGSTDELNVIVAGGTYGWPSGGGKAGQTLPAMIGGVGGCAVIEGNVYVSGLAGEDVFQATVSATGTVGSFKGLLAKKYGRINNVVGAPDGTLWLTTSNKDGSGRPVAADERVLHIPTSGGTGNSPV